MSLIAASFAARPVALRSIHSSGLKDAVKVPFGPVALIWWIWAGRGISDFLPPGMLEIGSGLPQYSQASVMVRPFPILC